MPKDFLTDDEMSKLSPEPGPGPAGQKSSAPDFIPDSDMDTLTAKGHAKDIRVPHAFNPKAKEGKTDVAGAMATGMDNYVDAFTGGYAPQVQAVTDPITSPIAKHGIYFAWKHGLLPGLDKDLAPKTFEEFDAQQPKDGDSYMERRDNARKGIEQESRRHPLAATVGTGGGIVGQALTIGALTGGAGAAAAGAGEAAEGANAVKKASMAKKLLEGAKIGGVMGALQNPGDVEGEISPLQLGDRGHGFLTGAATGVAGTALAEGAMGLGRGAMNAGQTLKDYAEEKAFKALGPVLKNVRKAYGSGSLQRIGRQLLDEGIVTPGASLSDIGGRVEEQLGKRGKNIGEIINDVDSKLKDPAFLKGLNPEQAAAVEKSSFNPKKVADDLKAKILPKLKQAVGGGAEAAKVEAMLDDLASRGDSMSTKQLQEMKQATDKLFNEKDWYTEGKPSKEAMKSIRGVLKDHLEAQANALDSATGGQGGRLKAENRAYGNLADATGIVNDRVNRNIANRFMSPSDYGMAGVGAVVGGLSGDGDIEDHLKRAAIGAGLGFANKGMRLYGNPIVASAADSVSKFLLKDPAKLQVWAKPLLQMAEKNPTAIPAAINAIARRTGFQSEDQTQEKQVLSNPALVQKFQDNPALIDNIQNPKLRAALKARFHGSSGESRMRSSSPGPQNHTFVPQDQSQKQFTEGNQ